MPTSRRRPVHDLPADDDSEGAVGPGRARRHRAPIAKGPPVVPIAIGGGLAVVILAVYLLTRGSGDSQPAANGGTAANATGAMPRAGGTASTSPPTGASDPKTPMVAAPQPPPGPTLNRAAIDARLAALTTAAHAADALTLGDEALKQTKDQALADLCFEKALALDPASATAKKKLDIRAVDPQADFPGLEEIQGSAQTYMIREFLKLRGKVMSRSERAKEVVRWTEKRKSVEARIAEAADDPFLNRIDRTRNDLANKPFFESFQFEVIESTRPYALFVELKGDTVTDRDARREAVEKAYQPFLAAYDQTIHNYLCKLSPKPPKDDPTFITFILLDRGSYDRFFLEFEGHAGAPGMRAHYTWREKWAFTYSPEVSKPNDPDFGEGTQSLLHELTHAWVDRLATDNDGRDYNINLVQTHWFNEGIAEFMSCHFLDGEQIRFQPWRSMRIKELSERPAGVRIPLKRGFRIGRHGALEAEASEIARAQKVVEEGSAMGICMSGFYADMSLFIFWLNYGNDGKYKKLFEEFARKELAGAGGPETADKVFAAVFATDNLEQQVDAFQQGVAKGQIKFADKELGVEQ